MTGAFMLSIVLFIIGCLEYGSSGGAVWGQAVLCIVWLLIYSLSIGPIGWTIPVEVSSTRLRSKSMVSIRGETRAMVRANATATGASTQLLLRPQSNRPGCPVRFIKTPPPVLLFC